MSSQVHLGICRAKSVLANVKLSQFWPMLSRVDPDRCSTESARLNVKSSRLRPMLSLLGLRRCRAESARIKLSRTNPCRPELAWAHAEHCLVKSVLANVKPCRSRPKSSRVSLGPCRAESV